MNYIYICFKFFSKENFESNNEMKEWEKHQRNLLFFFNYEAQLSKKNLTLEIG